MWRQMQRLWSKEAVLRYLSKVLRFNGFLVRVFSELQLTEQNGTEHDKGEDEKRKK